MNGSGFIKLFRNIREHPIWNSGRFSRGQAWVDLLLQANWRDRTVMWANKPITVKRGQVLTTQLQLAKAWGWNRKTVRAILADIERAILADIKITKGRDIGKTLITIRNFDNLQGGAEKPSDIIKSVPPDIKADILPDIKTDNTEEERKKKRRRKETTAEGGDRFRFLGCHSQILLC